MGHLDRCSRPAAAEGAIDVGRFRGAAHGMPQFHASRCGDSGTHGFEIVFGRVGGETGYYRNALSGDLAKVMAEQMVEYVLPQESSRQRRDIEVHFTGARFIEMQAGQRRLADKSAGDIEIIAVLVGAGAQDGVVKSDCVRFARYDMVTETGAARQLIRR